MTVGTPCLVPVVPASTPKVNAVFATVGLAFEPVTSIRTSAVEALYSVPSKARIVITRNSPVPLRGGVQRNSLLIFAVAPSDSAIMAG